MKNSDFAFVEPHERFERGWNRLQVSIEAGVAVIIGAGLLGVFGTGPLSSYEGRVGQGPATIAYERLMRRTVQSAIVLKLDGPVGGMIGETLPVTLPLVFTHHADVVSTSPRSASMRADTDGVTYMFELGATHQGEIVFTVKPRSAGTINATIAVGDAKTALRQFVFP